MASFCAPKCWLPPSHCIIIIINPLTHFSPPEGALSSHSIIGNSFSVMWQQHLGAKSLPLIAGITFLLIAFIGTEILFIISNNNDGIEECQQCAIFCIKCLHSLDVLCIIFTTLVVGLTIRCKMQNTHPLLDSWRDFLDKQNFQCFEDSSQ